MSLRELPNIALLKCLRYLDADSQNKIRQSCTSMNTIVSDNLFYLTERKLSKVVLEKIRLENEDQIVCFDWVIRVEPKPYRPVRKQSYACSEYGSQFFAALEGRGEMEESYYDINLSPAGWFADNFMNTVIQTLEFKGEYFDEEDVRELCTMLSENKTRVNKFHLDDTVYDGETADMMIGLIDLLKVRDFYAFDIQKAAIGELMTDKFWAMLPSLNSFTHFDESVQIMDPERIHIPLNFYSFPPTFRFRDGLMVSKESMLKAVQEWWNGRLRINVWWFVLPETLSDPLTMVESLGLPHTIGKEGDIRLTNMGGENITIEFCNYRPYRYKLSKIPCSVWRFVKRHHNASSPISKKLKRISI